MRPSRLAPLSSLPILLLTCGLLASAPVHAERSQFLSISANRLIMAEVVELGYGRALGPRGAVVGLIAGGSSDDQQGAEIHRAGAGVQGLWNAWGDFARGLHVGAETRYEWRGTRQQPSNPFGGTPPPRVDSSSHAWHFGPLVGARWTSDRGILFQVQGGLRWLVRRTTTESRAVTWHETDSGWDRFASLTLGYAW